MSVVRSMRANSARAKKGPHVKASAQLGKRHTTKSQSTKAAILPSKVVKLRAAKKIASKAVSTTKSRLSLVVAKKPATSSNGELSLYQREQLIIKYRMKARKLARSILRKWHSRLDLQEVDSIVDLSLCEAVRRFNPTKGAGFMTFMFYHLRGNLIRAVTYAATANLIPMGDSAAISACTDGHQGDETRITSDEGCANMQVASANEVVQALCSEDFPSPDEVLMKKELTEVSTSACNKLDPLEREVIERIYMQEEQLMDIASSLGYSRCHISRVKKKALEALQNDLTTYVGTEVRSEIEDDDDLPSIERRKVHRRRPRANKHAEMVEHSVAVNG